MELFYLKNSYFGRGVQLRSQVFLVMRTFWVLVSPGSAVGGFHITTLPPKDYVTPNCLTLKSFLPLVILPHLKCPPAPRSLWKKASHFPGEHIKTQIAGSHPQGSWFSGSGTGPGEFSYLTRLQVISMLLAWRPYSENHWGSCALIVSLSCISSIDSKLHLAPIHLLLLFPLDRLPSI